MIPSHMTSKGLIKIVKCVSCGCHQHYHSFLINWRLNMIVICIDI
ncbi:hypothetical protein C7Y46_04245 [Bacillus safensis]|nr:hypothetical protein C7Y46_04245 [Bacillus sp. SDF0016]